MRSARALMMALGLAALGGLLPAGGGAEEEEARVVLQLGGMTYVSSAGAENELVIEAERARVRPEEEVAELERMHAVIAPEAGAEDGAESGPRSFDMRCQRGVFQMASGDFVAEGDVRGVTGDGRHFRTTRLRYDHDEGLVMADVPVEIRDEAGTYRGGGFRYWVHDNRFRLSGGATVVQDEESKP